ncbi:MAG: penicillin-binding protein 2 [Clostridiales bacterium]|jgi:stage V sporulation protein D (sporulation-specific penicillin-binding protein)|nr:penicillin-binding protein 2 [Clostridiales bacterium]
MRNQRETIVKNRKFNSRMQARLLLVFCVVALLSFVLMGRLVYIIQQDGDRYAKNVLSRQSYVSAIIPYKRGDIYDRNGTVLARSELQYRLILDPRRLLMNEESIEPTLQAINEYFNIDISELQTILAERSESQYVILQKNLKHDQVASFELLMEEKKEIKGVWFDEEYVRNYPFATLASDIIGFTSADNVGYYGIEEYYNDVLNGTNGREYGYYDATLNIERIVKKPEHGNSVISTIDLNAQRIIQKHIKEFNTEFGSKNIGVLIMNPNNGEILAMASNQEYDLNNARSLEGIYPEEEIEAMTEEQKMDALNALWKNDIIGSGFEPGSTFKPITVAAALEEGLATKHSTYICDGGESLGGSYIRCSRRTGHGEITLAEALMYSCNDAMMQMANLEGKTLFYQYQKRLGLGEKTGIDLPGEEAGILIAEEKLNVTELATSSFGQSFNVTMIQLAAAYSSLVNGGNYYQPHVVKQIINENGATVRQIDKTIVRKTVSEETSKFIQEAMYRTVEEGTAKGAKVEGYTVGGKTGTAQKLPRDAKTYVVSFLGAVPAINPEIVIFVVVDEPQNVVRQDNSAIATELTSRILAEVLPALGVYPDGEIDYLINDEAENTEETSNTENGNTQNGNPNDTNSEVGQTNQSEENSSNSEQQSQTGEPASSNENGDIGTNGTQEQSSGDQERDANNINQSEGENSNHNEENNTDESEELDESSFENLEDEFNADAIGPFDE